MSGGGWLRRTVAIVNQRGLHARAAAQLVRLMASFDAEVAVSRGGQSVAADSIMGLLMLAAEPGAQLLICARGPQALQALDALQALVVAGFNEDDRPQTPPAP